MPGNSILPGSDPNHIVLYVGTSKIHRTYTLNQFHMLLSVTRACLVFRNECSSLVEFKENKLPKHEELNWNSLRKYSLYHHSTMHWELFKALSGDSNE